MYLKTNVYAMPRFLASVLFTLGALCGTVQAQTSFPTRAVTLVVPFPPGGPTDAALRVMLPALSQALGQDVLIDNKAGAHGANGAIAVMKAPPDGHTLLIGNSSPLVAVPVLRKNPPYDPVTDFSPVSFLGWTPLLLVVTPEVPAKLLAELIRHARANPGKLTVAAANPPTIFAMAQLRTRDKLDIASVDYPIDAAALSALLDGRAQIMAAGLNIALGYAKEGKLRPIATLGANRSRLAPDVPTMAEAGVKDFAILPWVAMFGPAGLPPPIAERLSHDVSAVLKRNDVREGLDRAAFDYKSSTPQELAATLKEQLRVWGGVAKEAGLAAH
jgi:tripartite-type tricarboxylate transporter receptor subunit TctC